MCDRGTGGGGQARCKLRVDCGCATRGEGIPVGGWVERTCGKERWKTRRDALFSITLRLNNPHGEV